MSFMTPSLARAVDAVCTFHASRLAMQAVDVPQPTPDVVPTPPTPHPTPAPGTPQEIPPLEQPPEIIEPPEPGQHVPVRDPMVPGASRARVGPLSH